jgi:hypothetical protein
MSDQPPYAPSTAGELSRPKPWRSKPILIAAGAVTVVVIAVVALLASGVFSNSGPFAIHGTLENNSQWQPGDINNNMWVDDTSHLGGCLDSETINVMATIGGRNVTVASGQLANGDGIEGVGSCVTSFTIRDIPGGYPAYGFQIQGVPGTVNMTRTQIAKGVGLSIGSGS